MKGETSVNLNADSVTQNHQATMVAQGQVEASGCIVVAFLFKTRMRTLCQKNKHKKKLLEMREIQHLRS